MSTKSTKGPFVPHNKQGNGSIGDGQSRVAASTSKTRPTPARSGNENDDAVGVRAPSKTAKKRAARVSSGEEDDVRPQSVKRRQKREDSPNDKPTLPVTPRVSNRSNKNTKPISYPSDSSEEEEENQMTRMQKKKEATNNEADADVRAAFFAQLAKELQNPEQFPVTTEKTAIIKRTPRQLAAEARWDEKERLRKIEGAERTKAREEKEVAENAEKEAKEAEAERDAKIREDRRIRRFQAAGIDIYADNADELDFSPAALRRAEAAMRSARAALQNATPSRGRTLLRNSSMYEEKKRQEDEKEREENEWKLINNWEEVEYNSVGDRMMTYKYIKDHKKKFIPYVNTPAQAIRQGCTTFHRRGYKIGKKIAVGRSREAADSYSSTNMETRPLLRRSYSTSFRPTVSSARTVYYDRFFFQLAWHTAKLKGKAATLKLVKQPYTTAAELHHKVSAMSEKQFRHWKATRETRKIQLEKAIKQRKLPANDAILAELEMLLLTGQAEGGSNIKKVAPTEVISRTNTLRGKPTIMDPTMFLPGVQKRFDTEFDSLVAEYSSMADGGIRMFHKEITKSESRYPTLENILRNSENYVCTLDKGKRCPVLNTPLVKIDFCTRTPHSSPDRRDVVASEWKEKFAAIKDIAIPWPTDISQDVINANAVAVMEQNRFKMEELHVGFPSKLLKLFNEHRKEKKKSTVHLVTLKSSEKLQQGWIEALDKYNKKQATKGESEVTLMEYKNTERRNGHEENALAHLEGYPFPPKQKYNPWVFYDENGRPMDIGRMWSELPEWMPRDDNGIRDLLLPMMMNGYIRDKAERNGFHKEEDFLAKMMLILGADHVALRQTLFTRFAMQKWEFDMNKKLREAGESEVSFFPPQPDGLCEEEFNKAFGICSEEGMRADWYYHPVVVIEPNRSPGSHLRVSISRYEKPLLPGEVEVVFPNNELGGGDFDYLVGRPMSMDDYSIVYQELSVREYHPLHVRYRQNMWRTYAHTMLPSSLRSLAEWFYAQGEETRRTNAPFDNIVLQEFLKAASNRSPREWMIGFEADRVAWEKKDTKSPFNVRLLSAEDRERQLKKEQPNYYKRLMALKASRTASQTPQAPARRRAAQSAPRPTNRTNQGHPSTSRTRPAAAVSRPVHSTGVPPEALAAAMVAAGARYENSDEEWTPLDNWKTPPRATVRRAMRPQNADMPLSGEHASAASTQVTRANHTPKRKEEEPLPPREKSKRAEANPVMYLESDDE